MDIRHLGILLVLVFTAHACGLPEKDLAVPVRDIKDTGIYDLSELHGDTTGQGGQFCEPIFVTNDNQCWSGNVAALH